MSALTQPAKVSLVQIWRAGVLAIMVAIVINAILYFVGAAFGAFPSTALTPMNLPITILPVIIMSLMGALAGTIGYTILSRFLSQANTNRWFTILAVIILVAMFFSPFGIQNAPPAEIVILEIMHLIVGGATIYFLTRSTT